MPAAGFYLNQRYISWDQLTRADPFTIYEEATLKFLADWKAGAEKFSIQTSGSTGAPKSIEIQRTRMTHSARQTLQYLSLNDTDHALVCLDTRYIGGMMMLVRAILGNMRLTIQDPDGSPLVHPVDNPTFTAVVPLQLRHMISETRDKLVTFRAILVGGAAVPRDLRTTVSKSFIPVFETYGMTETVSHIALKKLGGSDQDQYFQVMPGVSIRTNEHNCLEVRGEVTENTWISTNDVVRLYEAGTFDWLGRADNVINSAGIKIHPEQVEMKLARAFDHHHIANRLFIASRPDERLGNRLIIIIEGTSSMSEVQLNDIFKKSLNKYEVPKEIYFVTEMSETPTGKINRNATLSRLFS